MSPLPRDRTPLAIARWLFDWIASPAGAVTLVGVCLALAATAYTVDQTEQVVITQFGRPVGQPINADDDANGAGLHFKLPVIQEAHRFEKRILEWDGPPSEMPTRDKLYVVVDTFARWRIDDPLRYYQSLRDERSAASRLDDIIGSETRNVVARHDLIEMVRSDRERVVDPAAVLPTASAGESTARLPPIRFGRRELEREILAAAAPKVTSWGIELLDVRVKRLNYRAGVIDKIYDRMISEREQIAERFRSEGAGEAAKIAGRKEKDLRRIESEAYRREQEIMGEADATAAGIYAAAYAASPRAAEFSAFTRTLDTWQKTLGRDATLVLTTDSALFDLLKRIDGAPAPAPSPPTPNPPTPNPITPTPITPNPITPNPITPTPIPPAPTSRSQSPPSIPAETPPPSSS
ncbi:MAG: protease modulator HflC [Planctomycetes bacterium]|nr:protease modulator HflC [Planctomycetota bacterium]